jgi:hypothetical protein
LMFASRVAGSAMRLGTTAQTVGTPEALLQSLSDAGPEPTVVLDLTLRGFEPGNWVERIRQSPNPPRAILAFGPHVQEAALAAAKDAGCEVFTRGQFNARMDEILAGR